jgi:curved DNA-binding protein CbpA
MISQIERGLFKLDFTDHHAVLGVSVDADIKEIRKRYLTIVRRLHPDSFATEGEEEKQRASEFLSKLVNPAWEKLSSDRDRTEYGLLLKLKGQQAARQQNSLEISSGLARQLFTASNPDHFYKASLQDLADKQYQQLDQTLELTGQISELNVAYLIRKEGKGEAGLSEPSRTIYTGSAAASSTATPAKATATDATPQRRESLADQYYRRAEEFTAKNNFAKAILELRDALQIEPNNSRCHSLMGMVYLKQKQNTMAKIHFNQALKIDPKDPMALSGKQYLEQQSGTKSTPTQTSAKTSKPDKPSSGGGLFGGIFGGKKN